jgi:hypothetical protein
MNRIALAALAALSALVCSALPAGAAVLPNGRPLPNLDRRPADRQPPPAQRLARAALQAQLGAEGVVTTDGRSGGVRMIARRDGVVTAPRPGAPTAIALDYLRERADVFGLQAADIAALRLTSGYRSPIGVTHLAYAQTYLGVAAYDSVVFANVDDDGRLLNIGGAAVGGLSVPSVVPDLDVEAALAIARQDVGGSLAVPPQATPGRGPERPTRFADGDSARLTLYHDGSTARLAWRLLVTGEERFLYEVVVDATSGEVLHRRSRTEFATARVHEHHPGAPVGGVQVTVNLAGDGTWLDRAGPNYSRLRGNNAHAFADIDGVDGPTSGDAEVPAGTAAGEWHFASTPFSVPGQACPWVAQVRHCTWDSSRANDTRPANRNQATTQLFYFVNRFHDHLKAAPIGFTHEAGGFEFRDADGAGGGAGGDHVLAESDNYIGTNADTIAKSTNNARMSTPPDGDSPWLEAFFFANPSLNSADAADVVYHEYAHGLTTRTVGTGAGMAARQSRALGEGWSDWYALDFLARPGDGPLADTAAHGELTIGRYLISSAFRRQGIDCPVGSAAPACPGHPAVGAGGFTLGDLGKTGATVHDDGEIWGETLWDVRQALGPDTARMLVTGGLRLAPDDPSFLEARDAIIQADHAATNGANYATLWQVFARRGMGYSARTANSFDTGAQEAFDLPPTLGSTGEQPVVPPPGPSPDPSPPTPPPAAFEPPPPPPPSSTPPSSSPLPSPTPPASTPPASTPRAPTVAAAPARLQVLRAVVSRGRLDVRATIAARATGKVRVRYRTAGATTTFDAPIADGHVRFRKALPRSQRSKATGILSLTYAGTPAVEPDRVTLRAATARARLATRTSLIDSAGRLRVAGTITPRARGVVRVRLRYPGAGGSRHVDYRARITRGRWSLRKRLPAAAAAAGGQLTIRFGGHAGLRIGGEQIAREVGPRR